MAEDPCLVAPSAELLKGVEEFNRGEFYECHDTLEELWMAEARPVRCLYQGVLQIGVAFYHLGRSRYRPVVILLTRGSGYLEPFAPVCMGVDVAGLIADAANCLAEIKALGPGRLNEFDWDSVPKIKIVA
jgi:predicted metal-dependent hydrolase